MLFIGHEQNPRPQNLLRRRISITGQRFQAVSLLGGQENLKLASLFHFLPSFSSPSHDNLSPVLASNNPPF
jgi:hypothetical protein